MALSPEQIIAINSRSDTNLSNDGNVITQASVAPTPSSITPPKSMEELEVVNETPVVEEASTEPEINFDAFLDSKNTLADEPQLKKEVTPPSTEKEIAKEVEKPADPLHVLPTPKKSERDFTGLDDNEKALFEKMSNDALAKLKPIYLEHKTFKEQLAAKDAEIAKAKESSSRIPESYYEHENAYVLTPEFNLASKRHDNARLVYNHWIKQMEAAEEGAKEFDMIAYDDKTNTYHVSAKVPVTAASKAQLISYITYAQNQVAQNQGALQELVGQFRNNHYSQTQALIDNDKKYFNAFEAPEHKATYEPIIKSFLESHVPPAFRSSPLATSYAKALTLITVLGKKLTEAQAQAPTVQQTLNGKTTNGKATIKKAGPSAAEAASSSSGNGKQETEVSFDDFNAMKNSY